MRNATEKSDAERDLQLTELNPDLLTTPFAVQTNWHVITGAICCGKTTLIDMLAARGVLTLPESSRPYIEGEVAKGRRIEEIFASQDDERALTKIQRQAEHSLEANAEVFLDRALPDYLWFWRLLKLDPNELLNQCFSHRYASVFILDQLPLQLDGARIDDILYTDLFDEWLVRDYSALGYNIVRVPVVPPEERLAFVLDNVSGQKLIQAAR